ncbi:hypothetical protein D3C73_563290 [compost metagenome]
MGDLHRLLPILGHAGASAGGGHPGLQDHAVDRVILDHQHLHAVARHHVGVVHGDRLGLAPRHDLALDGEGEGRPLAQPGGHGDVAAHDVGQATRNRQAQSGASKSACRRSVHLGEGLEQLIHVAFGNARAAVDHREFEGHAALRDAAAACDETHGALVGELDRVRQQVLHHLADPQGVAAHHGRKLAFELRDELQPLGLGLGLERPDDAAMQIFKIHVDRLEIHPPGLDLGHVEDVVQQAQQVVARVADDGQIFALGPFEPGRAQQLGRAQHAVHRRAQFVRNDAQEVGLSLIGRVGLVAGGAQFLDQMGLMLLERADPLLAQHGHGHQDEQARRRKGR